MRGAPILMVLLLMASLSGCMADDGDTETEEPQDTETDNGDNQTVEPPETANVEVGLSGAYPATIAYDPETITVDNHTIVNLTFTNNDQAPIFSHDWVLEGYEETASTAVIANGETADVSFLAPPPGTYTFYCSVSGHRDNGMEGTFTVNA